MRIGIEAQRLFREKKHGLEIVALELIRNLQRIDKQNEYVIFVRSDKDNTCINETDNFKIREFRASSYATWEQIKLPKAIKAEKINLLHCTANTAPLFPGVPMLLTLHDIIFMEGITVSGNYYQDIGNLYRKLILPSIIRKCSKVLTVSESERIQIIKSLKLDSSRLDVIYNAVDSSFQKIDNQSLELTRIREKYNLPEKFILFFGNSAQKKNNIGTIKGYIEYASKNETPIPLIIAGAFQDHVKKELAKLHIPSSIQSHITVIGYIPFHEQPVLYNLAHLFLYTSLRESFGMPILESMACGTPVVTSNTSSMPEIAANAAILVNPSETTSIANGISQVLSDSHLYNRLVNDGYIRAGQFNWEASARKILQIYNEIGIK